MKNPTALDRDKWAKQSPPSPFPTQLQNIIPMFALRMPPPHHHKHFQLCLVLTKKPRRHQGWDYCFPNSPPPPAAHTSLCKLLERLKPQQEHRWPEQAGKMGIRYRQTPWDKPHGKTWLREEPWKAKQAQMLPSK